MHVFKFVVLDAKKAGKEWEITMEHSQVTGMYRVLVGDNDEIFYSDTKLLDDGNDIHLEIGGRLVISPPPPTSSHPLPLIES